MKRIKKIIAAALITLTAATMTACSADVQTVENYDQGDSMFVVAEKARCWTVVYHRNTKVMYAVSYRGEGSGHFTLLVNADGTPMTYKGDNADIPRVKQ